MCPSGADFTTASRTAFQNPDVQFAAINVARKLKVDPELALRASSDRFQDRVAAAAELAANDGAQWDVLDPEAQLGYYARARIVLGR